VIENDSILPVSYDGQDQFYVVLPGKGEDKIILEDFLRIENELQEETQDEYSASDLKERFRQSGYEVVDAHLSGGYKMLT